MGSNKLPFGVTSGGYSSSQQYEWQQLILRQREQATKEATPTWNEKISPSVDRSSDYPKGADELVNATPSLCNGVSFNWGSGTQNKHYQEDRYLPTGFPSGHFSEIDAAKHRSYMYSFCAKNIPDHTSLCLSHPINEASRDHTEKPFDDLHHIHPEQHVLSPGEDFYDHLDISKKCRNAYNGKMLRTKGTSQSFWENNSIGASVIGHGRNSCQKRYREQLSRHGALSVNQLAGQKTKKHNTLSNGACKEKPKTWCSFSELGQERYVHHEVHHGGSSVMINNNHEGNAEKNKAVAEENCYPKKNIPTEPIFCGSTKSNENSGVFSPRYSSKTIASSNGPKQSEGNSNMTLESDKRHSVTGCPRSPQNMKTDEVSTQSPQNLPVTHMEKGTHTKESDTASSLLRECLIIWRRRKFRKDNDAEAEKIIQANRTGAVWNGRPTASGSSETNDETVSAYESAPGHSESMDENGKALKNSKTCRSVIPPDGIQKHVEGRTNCNKNLQNRMAKQGLECNLDHLPDANPGDIMQENEQIKLPFCLQSIAHPEARIETSQNSFSDTQKTQICWNSSSDTSKVDQAAVLHPDISLLQMVSQHEKINDHLGARRKCKDGVSLEIKNETEGYGAKWCEQLTSLSTGPTVLDQGTAALWSLHDDNGNRLECSNQDSKTTPPFTVSKLDKGTANKCPNKPVNWSTGSDCRDIQGETMSCSILTNELVPSALADSGEKIHEEQTPSNEQISKQSSAEKTNSVVARPANRPSHFVIPDLNCLPSMITVKEELKEYEEASNHVTGGGLELQYAKQRVSAPFSGPAVQEQEFQQPQKTISGICGREVATGSRIPDSHSGPPERSTVVENSTSNHAFKSALGDFISNILRPLLEDGLLSLGVHNIIVQKAVEKVTIRLGPKVPRTEMAICRFLGEEESESVKKLVQGYLDLYVGSQVLKRSMPDNV